MSKYADDIATIKATTTGIQEDVAEIKKDVKDLNKLKERVAVVETKQGILAGINSGFTVLAAALAAWIGLQK